MHHNIRELKLLEVNALIGMHANIPNVWGEFAFYGTVLLALFTVNTMSTPRYSCNETNGNQY
jgi:hypothetical protein